MTLDTAKLNLLLASISGFSGQIKTSLDGKLAVDGVAADSLKLGGKTLAEIQTQIGDDLSPAVTQLTADFAAFIAREDNPHSVTKAQVGLGDVDNFGTATNVQALDSAVVNKFLTPAHLAAFWADKVGAAPAALDTIGELATALENNPEVIEALRTLVTDNSAAITALQTSKLDKADKAVAADVTTGTDDAKYVTALALKPALDAQALATQANADAIDDLLVQLTSAFDGATAEIAGE